MPSRRRFLQNSLALGAIAPEPPASATLETRATERISLDGEWMFRTDQQDTGEKQNWQTGTEPLTDWRTVLVPHTWQIERPLTEYRGVAWYRREFDTPRATADSAIRIEFEAVFHSARIRLTENPQASACARRTRLSPAILRGCCSKIVPIFSSFVSTIRLTSALPRQPFE